MQIGSAGSQAVIDYAERAAPAMKAEATRTAAQVLVLRKTMDTEKQVALDLISSISGVGGKLDLTG